MSLRVSVDFGTSSTCSAVSVDGGEPQVVVLDGQPIIPSAVFAGADGTLFVGHEAERQAAVDPARFEPHPKRRIDERELLLGSTVLQVGDAIRAVLRRAVAEARRYAGGAVVDLLVVTHPASWGSTRLGELRAAASGLGRELALVPEPVAAGVFHSARRRSSDGAALAVLDVGGGTVDASVVWQTGTGFRVLSTRGNPNFGGADVDQLLLQHLGRIASPADPAEWRRLSEGREMSDRRRRRVLRQDVKGAKETLSRHAYTDVPIPPPFTDAHVTRPDLERLIAEPLTGVADLVLDALRAGAVPRQQLAGVFLVGGSSRIPMVARLIHERIGVLATTLDQPETVVARGALRAVQRISAGAEADAAPGRSGADGSRATADVSADSLSRASTVVMTGSDPTRPVQPPRRRKQQRRKQKRRASRRWVLAAVAGVLVIAAVVVWTLLTAGDPASAEENRATRYGYSFEYPSSWQQGRADPQLWETTVAPRENADAADSITVRRGGLPYNADTERARAVQELRNDYERLVGTGKRMSGFEDRTTFAGRDVVHYGERLMRGNVDWYVVHKGQTRVSVGCRDDARASSELRDACARVVDSLDVR